MDIILRIAAFFEMILSSVSRIGFGAKEAIAMTAVFVVIAGLRFAYLWMDFVGNEMGATRGFVMFAKAQFRNVVIWFLVAASPVIFSSIASATSAGVRGATSPIAAAGNKTFSVTLDALTMTWHLRAWVEYRVRASTPWLNELLLTRPDPTDAADGTMAATDFARQWAKLAMGELTQQKAAADAAATSSDPRVRKMGQIRQGVADGALAGVSQAKSNIDQAARDEHAALYATSNESDLSVVARQISENVKTTVTLGLPELVAKLAAFIGSLLAVAPALFLIVSALLKIISSMVELMTYIFGFVAMVVVVGAVSVGLAPLAMLSFVSEQWSKYGWNFVGFWLQALVASAVMGSVVSIIASAFDSLTGMISYAGLLVASGVLGSGSVLDMAKNALLAGLLFLAVGMVLSFFATLLQKAVGGAVGVVNGAFHP